MDWFLCNNGLRHERVKPSEALNNSKLIDLHFSFSSIVVASVAILADMPMNSSENVATRLAWFSDLASHFL